MATLAIAAPQSRLSSFPSAAIVIAALSVRFRFAAHGCHARWSRLRRARRDRSRSGAVRCGVEPRTDARRTRGGACVCPFHERAITFAASAIAVAVAVAITRGAYGARSRAHGRRARGLRSRSFSPSATARSPCAPRSRKMQSTRIWPRILRSLRVSDPVVADGRGSLPPIRPTLKIARDRVALDDTPAILLHALDTDAGVLVLRSDLAHRIAREGETARVDLLVMADASTAPNVVRDVFERCVRCGRAPCGPPCTPRRRDPRYPRRRAGEREASGRSVLRAARRLRDDHGEARRRRRTTRREHVYRIDACARRQRRRQRFGTVSGSDFRTLKPPSPRASHRPEQSLLRVDVEKRDQQRVARHVADDRAEAAGVLDAHLQSASVG